jgi:hypothetical protein
VRINNQLGAHYLTMPSHSFYLEFYPTYVMV